MNRKLIGIFVCMLFIVSSLPGICSYNNLNDSVDQQQLIRDSYVLVKYPGLHAQSFKPALDTLTRVELLLNRDDDDNPTDRVLMWIKSDLYGDHLVSKSIYVSSIPTTGYNWVEFDFTDIGVTIDSTYYIVVNGGPNLVRWGFAMGDVYPRGMFWAYHSYDEWVSLNYRDFAFKTYGYNQNQPPYKPSKPSGPESGYCGVSYTYSTGTTDPDDNEVTYGWDWDGDFEVDEWSEFLPIGTNDSRQHSFSSAGKYNVRVIAKDPHFDRSEWSEVLEVTIENGTLIVDAGGPYEELLENPIQFNGEVTNGSEPYTWEWIFGDGATAEIQNPIHTYENIGVYNISLTVLDNEGKIGTDETIATIIINNPPNKPSKPIGQINGTKEINYLYTTYTTDPDGNQVYYMWDWGDETNSSWLGPKNSGSFADASHSWAEGTYAIRVKAKDIFDAESDWSDPLEVTMPKSKINNKIINNAIFERISYVTFDDDEEPPVTNLYYDTATGEVTLIAIKYPLNSPCEIKATYYKIDSGDFQVYTTPFILPEGTHTVYFYSEDTCGNKESLKSKTLTLDTTPPTVSITSPRKGRLYLFGSPIMDRPLSDTTLCIGIVPVAATADDNGGSGVNKVLFSYNGETGWDDTAPYTDVFTGRVFGNLTISVTAIDNLGHESDPVEVTVKCYSLG